MPSPTPPVYSQAQQQRQALTDALNSPVLAPERDSISYSNIGLGLLSYSDEEEDRPYARKGRESRVQSLEVRKQVISQAGELGTMPLSPTPLTPIYSKGRDRQHERPITIIDFPDPQLNPSQSPWTLPPPSSPISPMLASPHPSYLSSSDNASIRGLNILSEKKALFRSDDEAVAAAIPRIGGRQRMGVASVAGPDFWKRFSTVVRLDEASKRGRGPKDEGWLERHKAKSRRLAVLVAVLSVLVVGIILFCAIFFSLQAKANAPKNQGNLPTYGTAVSHSANKTATSAITRITAAAS